jgi:hypothetical protein
VSYDGKNYNIIAFYVDGAEAYREVYPPESGQAYQFRWLGPNGGNGVQTVIYKGNSQDGSRAFFETAESLISSDSDTARDVYQWASGTVTEVVAAGTLAELRLTPIVLAAATAPAVGVRPARAGRFA